MAAHLQAPLSLRAFSSTVWLAGYKAYKMQKFDADLFFRYRALARAFALQNALQDSLSRAALLRK